MLAVLLMLLVLLVMILPSTSWSCPKDSGTRASLAERCLGSGENSQVKEIKPEISRQASEDTEPTGCWESAGNRCVKGTNLDLSQIRLLRTKTFFFFNCDDLGLISMFDITCSSHSHSFVCSFLIEIFNYMINFQIFFWNPFLQVWLWVWLKAVALYTLSKGLIFSYAHQTFYWGLTAPCL